MSFGGPQWSSQTGVQDNVARFQPEPAPNLSEGVLARRTEYLEKEGKTMRESVQNIRNETKRESDATTRALYSEMQWVYGTTTRANTEGRVVWMDVGSTSRMVSNARGTRLLLVYPMRQLDVEEDHTQYLMRCKTVDRQTGQIDMLWVVVHERVKGKDIRYVEDFGFS